MAAAFPSTALSIDIPPTIPFLVELFLYPPAVPFPSLHAVMVFFSHPLLGSVVKPPFLSSAGRSDSGGDSSFLKTHKIRNS